MPRFLGIDTSNYTTSAAVFDSETGELRRCERLLPVPEGEIGLRSGEVVFTHVKRLPGVIREVAPADIAAVAVSDRPRDAEGSYMPCFLVGSGLGESVAALNGVPFYGFSHQAGHITAALFSAGELPLLDGEFLSFHLSGGTTECLAVKPDQLRGCTVEIVGQTLDLNAGQLIDRVGAALGMQFPAGAALDVLAREAKPAERIPPVLNAAVKGTDCCLSGFENKCRELLRNGTPAAAVAHYLFEILAEITARMTQEALARRGDLPVVFAGGVAGNSVLRDRLLREFGERCIFAAPGFSSDNACGTAILAARRYFKEER